jgi:small-conductance mechanosensitive channel
MDGWIHELRRVCDRLEKTIDRRDEYGLTDNERNAKNTRDYATELLKQATEQGRLWQARCSELEQKLKGVQELAEGFAKQARELRAEQIAAPPKAAKKRRR